jgi:DNA-binding IclR family transcriptional regulator
MAQLLDALANNDGEASLKILSAETGLHPSTAFRILGSLVQVEFVERTASGSYRLGTKLRQLVSRIPVARDVRAEALPVMEGLRDALGETVNLTVREGDEVVYIERVTPKRMMRVEQVIGSRAPLHVTAVGKLMLGEEGQAGCLDYARRTGLPAFTSNTITDSCELGAACAAAHTSGYALDNEEAELGVGCIGVLVRDASGRAIAGLSVSAPIERRRDEWVALVQQAGERLSRRLGLIPGQD